MRFSLSIRLALLFLVSLGCVLIPTMTATYVYVGKSALRADKENFIATLRLVEENINTSFMHLNATKLDIAMRAKERLRTTAKRFSILIDLDNPSISRAGNPVALALEAAMEALRRELIRESEADAILLDFFPLAAIEQGPQTRLGLLPEVTDLKKRSLRDVLAKLSSTGDFGVYHLPEHPPMLVYFMPAHGKVVVCAISIRSLEDEAEAAAHTLLHDLEKRFNSLSLHPNGFIAILNNSGNKLTAKGAFGPAELTSLPPLLHKARTSGSAIQESVLLIKHEDGSESEYLAAANFSRQFQWFTVIAAPIAEISAPSRALLGRLVTLSILIGLGTLLVSLLLLQRAIRPLRLLLPKLTALPDMDFSSPKAAKSIAEDLPLNRQDEVGDLARSFSAMGERLQMNIRARMESSSVQERILGELGAAREIQHGILPPPELAPNIFGVSSAAILEPAREIGGDLYYFFTLPDKRYAFIIGDVSGKGVPAALFMAITVTLARYTLAAESDPGAALSRINTLLEAHNPQTMFVTLFLALYDPKSGRLDYANAGHTPPLLVESGGLPTYLEGLSGPMAGVMPDVQYQSFSRTLREGELCLLYTDGVTEAVNKAKEPYSEKRLEVYLTGHSAKHPKDLLISIFEDVKRFRGEAAPFDDITMLAFARR